MSDALARICADKLDHVAARKAATPVDVLERAETSPPRGFARALEDARASGRIGLIAEIKKASPSKGLIRADFDPPALARAYEEGGADCLSILTDRPYFQGEDAFLGAASAAVALPCLRKDFMLDPYQIVESRALGADCVLLIMAALDDGQARELDAAARGLGMDVLIETHDRAELERALRLKPRLLGVNNRDLKSLRVSLETFEILAKETPADALLIAESGIFTAEDVARMGRAGAAAVLVGESMMRRDDVAAAARALMAPVGG